MSAKLKACVFVVDNESVIASTLELILRKQGLDAHSFADPITALKAAQSKSPDLLVTDVAMPQMNGVDLAMRIKQDYPNCKILFLTASVTILDLLAEVEAAGHDFVLVDKPVHPAILIGAIQKTLQDTD